MRAPLPRTDAISIVFWSVVELRDSSDSFDDTDSIDWDDFWELFDSDDFGTFSDCVEYSDPTLDSTTESVSKGFVLESFFASPDVVDIVLVVRSWSYCLVLSLLLCLENNRVVLKTDK